jgi:hypothetical protein
VAVAVAVVGLLAVGADIGARPAAAASPKAVSQEQAIVDFAASQAGTPYCNGGGITGPSCTYGPPGYSCMSLAEYAVYQATGIVIPGSGSPLDGQGTYMPQAMPGAGLLPGDVVFWGNTGGIANYVHSGVYAGNGLVWDSYDQTTDVETHTFSFLQQHYNYDGAIRYWTGSTSVTPPPFTSTTPPPPGSYGYDLVGADGGVFVFSGAYHGSLPGLGVHVDDITGIVPTTTDDGYFLVGADGGVFAFNAHFANSLPGVGVHVDDIVGIVPTLDDQGYFLVGRDGGVFSFNAPFENSLPGIGVHVDDITGIAVTADDQGYWLVGANGAVYAFGDAHFDGAAPAGAVGITATHDGGGYWVVGADGSVTPFGDAGNFADLPELGVTVDDIVGIVVSPDSKGYNLIGADGGVFSFGDAANRGSLPGLGVIVDDVVGAVPT